MNNSLRHLCLRLLSGSLSDDFHAPNHVFRLVYRRFKRARDHDFVAFNYVSLVAFGREKIRLHTFFFKLIELAKIKIK